MNTDNKSISLTGLLGSFWYILSAILLTSPAIFCFWLADWHVHVNVLARGEPTQARVVAMDEEWSRWINTSSVDARKSYYLSLEYTDDSGDEHTALWDSSLELFSKVQTGHSIPILYLPGESKKIIPRGETYQAFVDSGEYGPAGIIGILYLIGAIPFLTLVFLYRIRGKKL